jgi:hypothetical protein
VTLVKAADAVKYIPGLPWCDITVL